MRPETAAGAPEARSRVCHCPTDRGGRPPPPREPESPTPWRPWIGTPRDAQRTRTGSQRQEYLQSSGEKVLASFPVQATIHFYDDASDSEDAEHEEDPLPPQEAQGQEEDGPGRLGRDQLVHPGQRSGGHGSSLGGAECSSSK